MALSAGCGDAGVVELQVLAAVVLRAELRLASGRSLTTEQALRVAPGPV